MAAPPAAAAGDTLVFAVQPGTQVGSGALTIDKLEVYRTSNGTYYPKAELKCSGATYYFSGPLDLVSLKATASNSDLTLFDAQKSGAFSGPGRLDGTFSPALDSGAPVLKVTSWEGCRSYSSNPTDVLQSTVPPPVPAPFAGCAATPTSSGIDVTWPAQSGVSGYTVTSTPASTTKKSGVNTTATFTYGELTADTEYTFTVNGAGTGAGVTCTTATARTLPGAPTGMVDRYGAITDQGGQVYQEAIVSMPQPPAGFDAVWFDQPSSGSGSPTFIGATTVVQWVCGSTLALHPAYVSPTDITLASVGPALTITPTCTVPDVRITNPLLSGSQLTFGYDVASGTADGVTFEYRTRTTESKVTSAWTALPIVAPGSSGGSSTVRVSGIRSPEAVELSLRAVNGPKRGASTMQVVQPNPPARSLFQVRYDAGGTAPVSQSAVYNETGVVGTTMTIAPTVYPSGQAATYSVTAGVLPAGLLLDPQTGTITGTPTGLVSGSQVTVTATRASDATGKPLGTGAVATASAILSFTISAQAVTAALAYPNATVAVGHAVAVTPQNATPGYVYAIVTAPGLPGIAIDSATGRVTWNAPYGAAGSHVVTIRETAPGQAPVDVAFTITVTAAPGATPAGPSSAAEVVADGGMTGSGGASSNAANADVLNPCGATGTALYADFGGSVNSSLAFAPNVAGLPAPVSFAITSGTLPMGVRLDSTSGLIWGTPELANDGRGPVQVSATFVDGTVRSSAFNIAVDDPHQALNYPVIVRATEGNALTVTPTSLHPHGTVRYRVVCGTVPTGMRFDATTGVLAGTPTQPQDGSMPLRVRMTDSYGWVDASLTVVVGSAPEPWLRYPDYARVGIDEKVTITPVATSLGSDVRFQAEGALPPGFVFNRTTGAFSGTARKLDEIVYEPTITAYRSDGSIVTKTVVSLNVISPTVPLHVVSRKASRPIPAGKRTTLVSQVRTPSWAFTTTKVACGPGCRAAVNRTTGKVIVSGVRKGQRVTVTVITRTKPSARVQYGHYLPHGWRVSWRVG
jgi:large repetitive protein